MTAYRVWDIETSVKRSYKRKANPFDPENYIVSEGWVCGTLGTESNAQSPSGVYYGRDALPADWFSRHLTGLKLLVGQNIKFDIMYALANPNVHPEANLAAWMEFVGSGGIVWDVQLAEYLLEGMAPASHMMSLDELAPQYGGNVKVDEVKKLWEAGVDTIDIDEDLLMRYLLGGENEEGKFEEGDIGNTERVFLGQWKRATESGQLRSILLNMGALIATIEMERNGMRVDKQRGLVLAAELEATLAAKKQELQAYLPADIPFEFKWSSRFHKSALIFGGDVNYDARVPVRDEQGELTYFQKEALHYVMSDGTTMECAWYEHVRDTEWQGEIPDGKDRVCFAAGKNKGEPKTKKVKGPDVERGPKTRIEKLSYTFPGFTQPLAEWKSSPEGVYKTGSEVIEALSGSGIPFLKVLGEVSAMSKDLGTYFITTDDDGAQKGMLTLVQPDGIIHHSLNHTSTVTGRFSSSDPNLQNIPKGNKSDVKTLFVSRHGADGVICQSDFSSLEVYIQAILTGSRMLLDDLRSGKDMHCVRLAAKEHMEYDRVFELCKVIADPEWDYKRTKAKVFSFQRAYGAGVPKIAKSTGMPEDEVQALADAEDARYPEIPAFYEQLTKDIQANRVPTGTTVPHPELPGVFCQLGRSYSFTPDGKKYSYRESPAPAWLIKRKHPTSSFSPTEIKNYVVQGTGGEWAKAALWLSVRAFYFFKNFDGLALLVNQVHDAEYGDFHKSVAAKAAAVLHVCMEEASTYMAWYFNWPLPISVPSDTVWGASMMDEDKIKDEVFHEAVKRLRPWVRDKFIGGYQPEFV